ncbi:MAG: FAD-binding oxidoreductase [Actinobacteria bacterium]|nr:FAD-binding oxidoreductase [Actinomycetota bacterium]
MSDSLESEASEELLAGWGRTAPTHATVVHPHSAEAAAELVATVNGRGVVARGLGRGYGDCAQNAGGMVVDGPSLSGLLNLDWEQGVVRVQAGTSLDDLMRWLVPLGWFVPVTPGTRMVTVGGAIAADIHGKNHHVKGTFAEHVRHLRLIDGFGEVRDVTPEGTPELFRATAGGMGLTGVITEATIQMTPIGSSLVSVDTDRTSDLDEVMQLMVDGDADYEYSVAWIDLIATGRHMGRSILQRGRFASAEEARASGAVDLYSYAPKHLPSPPDLIPSGLLNRRTVRAFNELWYRKAPACRRDELQTIEQFFHPLDMIAGWNRIYGHRGFLQWQFVVPDSGGEIVRTSVERLSSSGVSSFLAVLKRFGPANDHYLSFPQQGWTLALDIPVVAGLDRLLDELDELVVEAGGSIYLAKDSRVRRELVPLMYPQLDTWREVRRGLDPEGHFRSDLARRLELC